jgi:hypothetical protein
MSCVRTLRSCWAPVYALQEAMTEASRAAPAHASEILIRPHGTTTSTFSRRYQQREGEVHTRSPPPKWAQVSGVKAQIYATTRAPCCSATVPYNVIASQLRQVFTVPNDARITVTEDQNNIPTQEEHLVGLDEELKTNPSAAAPRPCLYPEA